MKQSTLAFCAVLALHFSVGRVAQARDLNQLISSLYGGNGITLAANSHNAHFAQETSDALNQLNRRLGTDFGVFPFNSSAGSFSFAFDADLGTFVSTTDTLGPIFSERSQPLGQGKWSVSLYSTFFKYDTFNGKSLHNLHVTAKHDADTAGYDPSNGVPNHRDDFELDTLDVKVDVRASVWMISPAVTYGVTENLDVSLLVPLVSVDLDVRSLYRLHTSPATTLPDPHDTDPTHGAENPRDRKRGSATGVGDLVLGAKYRFLQNELVDLAAATLVKLPTGDADNFLGSGDTTVRPALVASRTFRGVLWEKVCVTPHVNVGYEINASQFDRSSFRYTAGFDAGTQRFTLAAELLGAHFNAGYERLDASVGAKFSFYKQWVLSGNVILPLNNTGARSDLITTLGVGLTF